MERLSGIDRDEFGGLMHSYPHHGVGTGFFINDEGYIVTNAHVVRSYSIENFLLTLLEYGEAEIIGMDEIADIALIKIDPRTNNLLNGQIVNY